MAQQEIDSAHYDALAAEIGGSIVLRTDPGYDGARSVWNAMIDKHPAVIVRAATIADIPPAVAFAREHGLPLAIRGGGHSVAGHGTVEDGMVLDLAACNEVRVDPIARTVTVGPGATLGDLDAATSRHSLAVPAGVLSTTGVAGLTLGGGFGWLTRAHGLSVDNLLAADVITASGRQVHADATTNPELLWALKGGGGNFGVVSSFTFRAHPLPEPVFCGNLVYLEPQWRGALEAFAGWAVGLPDPMTPIITVLTPPPAWDLGTEPVLVIGFLWADADPGAGRELIETLIAAAPPDMRDIAPTTWRQWQTAVDAEFPKGVRAYWKNSGLKQLDDAAIGVITAFGAQQRWRGTAFDIHLMGGAFARTGPDATPFGGRDSAYWINIYGFWPERQDDEHHVAFIRALAAAMEPFSSGGQYLNFMGAEPAALAGTAAPVYAAGVLERLREVKRLYDPENVFRFNHNVLPAAPNESR